METWDLSDIGCGVSAIKTSLTNITKDILIKISEEIRKVIPTGFHKHSKEQDESLMPDFIDPVLNSPFRFDPLDNRRWMYYPIIVREYDNARKSLGTLGGGNHFIEIQQDQDGHIWIMIHSGSRNLGKQVCNHYNNIAKQLNKRWHSNIDPNSDLAFLPLDSEEGQCYLREMEYCVKYALANRTLMMNNIIKIFERIFFGKEGNLFNQNNYSLYKIPNYSIIDIPHNYASIENHFNENVIVHRKGAILAREGTIGIIPGSQGTKSYIVRGWGNPESFMSCSHGAGRVMSRKRAKLELNLQDEINKMNTLGIIHNITNIDNLVESSSAYKNIDEVMENQKDLVDILIELKPLCVVKG